MFQPCASVPVRADCPNSQIVHLKKAHLQQRVLQEAMRECTFKPTTNEGVRREILCKLLAADTPTSLL